MSPNRRGNSGSKGADGTPPSLNSDGTESAPDITQIIHGPIFVPSPEGASRGVAGAHPMVGEGVHLIC